MSCYIHYITLSDPSHRQVVITDGVQNPILDGAREAPGSRLGRPGPGATLDPCVAPEATVATTRPSCAGGWVGKSSEILSRGRSASARIADFRSAPQERFLPYPA